MFSSLQVIVFLIILAVVVATLGGLSYVARRSLRRRRRPDVTLNR